jgi:hypothetical protein
MNWKQFLKPDWKKIITFGVFLIILFSLSPFTYQPSFLFWFNPSFQLAGEIVYKFQSCIPADLWPICSGFDYYGVSIMIISFLFWYIIVCIAIWTYYKIKEKESKS